MGSSWDTLQALSGPTHASPPGVGLPLASAWPSSQAAHLARSRVASRAAFHVDGLARARADAPGLRAAEVAAATDAARALGRHFARFVGDCGGEEEAAAKRRRFVERLAGEGAVGGVVGRGRRGFVVVDQALHGGVCAFWKGGDVGKVCEGVREEAEWAKRWVLSKRIVDAEFDRKKAILNGLRSALERVEEAGSLMKTVGEAEEVRRGGNAEAVNGALDSRRRGECSDVEEEGEGMVGLETGGSVVEDRSVSDVERKEGLANREEDEFSLALDDISGSGMKASNDVALDRREGDKMFSDVGMDVGCPAGSLPCQLVSSGGVNVREGMVDSGEGIEGSGAFEAGVCRNSPGDEADESVCESPGVEMCGRRGSGSESNTSDGGGQFDKLLDDL